MTDGRRQSRFFSEGLGKFVARFQAGDDATSRKVQRRVSRILMFRGWGIPPEDQKDLTQQIMWQLWEATNKENFRAEGFWKFVEIVASRRCIDWRRAQRQNRALEDVDEPSDSRQNPLTTALQKEKVERAHAVLAQLSPECRNLIRLHVAEGKSYREIAEILGDTEGALRVRMHRCIQRARKVLQEADGSSHEGDE